MNSSDELQGAFISPPQKERKNIPENEKSIALDDINNYKSMEFSSGSFQPNDLGGVNLIDSDANLPDVEEGGVLQHEQRYQNPNIGKTGDMISPMSDRDKFSKVAREGAIDYADNMSEANTHAVSMTSVQYRNNNEPVGLRRRFSHFMQECCDDMIRNLFYDEENPEFTSLQQFSWAVLIGVFMGVMTAKWADLVEWSVEFVWKEIPEFLLEKGIFTELDGSFPLPYYMIICPALFGGVLSFISVKLPTPIPGQNEWIESVHILGVLDHTTFFQLIIISTLGMASGLSLGPELPLVLSAGMVGSFLGSTFHQSILSARVMNLTAASAAIGGFFGFPMAGALFVLEIPHRMGLQYFEALSPSTIASIVAVLVNRMVTGNDIKGYFNYPFLTASLPSHIFYAAVLYGIVGSVIGVFYAEGCLKLKTWVHDWFHHHEHHDDHAHDKELEMKAQDINEQTNTEAIPLVGSKVHMYVEKKKTLKERLKCCWGTWWPLTIEDDASRAAVVGVIAGAIVGVVCMFLPHNLFWGEAQLQTLIDKGRTPLPVFGIGDEPTADLTAYGYCMIDNTSESAVDAGFDLKCSFILTVTKVIVIGLSLGTGIVGGHFWGPLYVGAIGAQFFNDAVKMLANDYGIVTHLADFPCVSLLCIMGSTHVVTFRAHMAIMLILTLTISAFIPEDFSGGYVGGDYSAVFPLLVVSCFVSLMFTRSTVFYKKQRCRGDIIASPQVLCEPGQEGQPEYPKYCVAEDEYDSMDSGSEYTDDSANFPHMENASVEGTLKVLEVQETDADIEAEFERMNQMQSGARRKYSNEIASPPPPPGTEPSTPSPMITNAKEPHASSTELEDILGEVWASQDNPPHTRSSTADFVVPQPPTRKSRSHRRVHSGSELPGSIPKDVTISQPAKIRTRASSYDIRGRVPSIDRQPSRDRSGSRERSSTPTSAILMKVESFGELTEYQPSLMNQARTRSSSVTKRSGLPMGPSKGSNASVGSGGKGQEIMHRRKNSGTNGSFRNIPQDVGGNATVESNGAIPAESIERAFSTMHTQGQLEVEVMLGGGAPPTRNSHARRRSSSNEPKNYM